jgi:peptidoglycan/LPS O-acetylase OafA/YrhL
MAPGAAPAAPCTGRGPRVHAENAFDAVRVLAAWAVLYSHSFAVVGVPEPTPLAGQTYGRLAVGVFFALSGYLVCGSWLADPSPWRFAARRALRIVPGLVVNGLVTALLIAGMVTSLPAADYYRSGSVWSYVLKLPTLLSSAYLPGVFESNPLPHTTNASLWTLRYEVLMYACLAAIGWLTPARLLKATCLVGFALFVVGASTLAYTAAWPHGIVVESPDNRMRAEAMCMLGAYFFGGCVLWLWRTRLQLPIWLVPALLIPAAWVLDPRLVAVYLCFVIPVVAIAAGLNAPQLLRGLNGHDYSYGIYIYAFPVQQALLATWPAGQRHWFATLFIATAATVVIAAFSWHCVEGPALRLKPRLFAWRTRGGGVAA